jgi:ribosomal protein S18 acetylase RimI-like enzyme
MTLADYEPALALWKVTPGMGIHASDTRERLGRYLERNPGMSFVARREGELVGVVISGHDGHRGYLHRLAVAESCRGLGIGSRLVQLCLQAMARVGMDRTHIFVHSDNDLGLGFWKRAGWKRRDDVVMFTFIADGGTPRPR